LTWIGVRGFEPPALDHRPRDTVKSKSPISKEGDHAKSSVGVIFPDREIEGPVSVLQAEEGEDLVSGRALGSTIAPHSILWHSVTTLCNKQK